MDLSVLDYDMESLKPNIIGEKIFRVLQKHGWSLSPKLRYVALSMLEVNPKEYYNVKDDEIYEKSLILSMQHISNSLTQPIGCLFYKKNVDPRLIAEKLEHYIKDLIKCELFVVVTLSNVSERIKKVIDVLIEKSKRQPKDYYDALTYRVANMDIVHVFDPISLIEDTRDVFLCHNIQCGLLGQRTKGKFTDFTTMVQHGCGVEKFKINFAKHKVDSTGFAISLFSMASFVSLVQANAKGIIARVGTKEVVNLFDMAFDTLNANADLLKINRYAISKTSPHHANWEQIVNSIKSIKLIRNNTRLDLALRVMITILKMSYHQSMQAIKEHLDETTLDNDLYNINGTFLTPKGILNLKSEIIKVYIHNVELITASLVDENGVERELVAENRNQFLLNLMKINDQKLCHVEKKSGKIERSDGESDEESDSNEENVDNDDDSDSDFVEKVLFLNPCAVIPKTLEEILIEKKEQEKNDHDDSKYLISFRDDPLIKKDKNNDFLLSCAEEQDQQINLLNLLLGKCKDVQNLFVEKDEEDNNDFEEDSMEIDEELMEVNKVLMDESEIKHLELNQQEIKQIEDLAQSDIIQIEENRKEIDDPKESAVHRLDENNKENKKNDLLECLFVLKKLENEYETSKRLVKNVLNDHRSLNNKENQLKLSINDDYIVVLINSEIEEIVSEEKTVTVYKGISKPSEKNHQANKLGKENNKKNQNLLHNPKTGEFVMIFKTPKDFCKNQDDENQEDDYAGEEFPGVLINLIEDNCEYDIVIGLVEKNHKHQIYMRSEISIEGNRFLGIPNIFLVNEEDAETDEELNESFTIIETCNNCLKTITTKTRIRVIQIPENKDNQKKINHFEILTQTYDFFKTDAIQLELFVTNRFLNLINLTGNNYLLPKSIEYNKILALCNWLYVTEGFSVDTKETSLNFSVNIEKFFEMINSSSSPNKLNHTVKETLRNLNQGPLKDTIQELNTLGRQLFWDEAEEDEFDMILKTVPLCITGWANSCNGMSKLLENLLNKRINILRTAFLNLNTTRSIMRRIKTVYGMAEVDREILQSNVYIDKDLIVYALNHQCAVFVQ